ncbi:MAG TPA: hypothetical protein VF521_00085, partial [Pyrinomonadaceae bacterium]
MNDVVVRVEDHRHAGRAADGQYLGRAVGVLVVLQHEPRAHLFGQALHRLGQLAPAPALAAVKNHRRVRRARLAEQVEDARVRPHDLDAVGDDVGRLGVEDDELVRVEHEAHAERGGQLADA